jgi:hypothetical protein
MINDSYYEREYDYYKKINAGILMNLKDYYKHLLNEGYSYCEVTHKFDDDNNVIITHSYYTTEFLNENPQI